MFYVGICDDEKYTCEDLKERIYTFGEKEKLTLMYIYGIREKNCIYFYIRTRT